MTNEGLRDFLHYLTGERGVDSLRHGLSKKNEIVRPLVGTENCHGGVVFRGKFAMYSGCLINLQQPNVIAPPFLSPDCPDQLVVARILENTAGRPAHCYKDRHLYRVTMVGHESQESGLVRSGAIAVLRLARYILELLFDSGSTESMTGKTFDSPHPNDTVLRSLLSASLLYPR